MIDLAEFRLRTGERREDVVRAEPVGNNHSELRRNHQTTCCGLGDRAGVAVSRRVTTTTRPQPSGRRAGAQALA